MSVTINGTSGVTTPGIANSEGYSGDGLTIAAGAPAGAVTVDASGNVGVGVTPTTKFDISGQGRATTGWAVSSDASTFTPSGLNAVPNYGVGYITSASQTTLCGFGGTLFYTGQAERMRIDQSGNLLVGTTSANGLGVTISGTIGNNFWLSNTSTTGAYNHFAFRVNGTGVGFIQTTSSTTSYVTSSDYRLKENVQPMTNALDKISALKPVTYTWKADGSADRGFIAHELQEIIPQAVSGEKDAVDAEGNIQPQGVDYGKITPEIVAAIQELKARIEQLEAK